MNSTGRNGTTVSALLPDDPAVPIFRPGNTSTRYQGGLEIIKHFLLSNGLFNGHGWEFDVCEAIHRERPQRPSTPPTQTETPGLRTFPSAGFPKDHFRIQTKDFIRPALGPDTFQKLFCRSGTNGFGRLGDCGNPGTRHRKP